MGADWNYIAIEPSPNRDTETLKQHLCDGTRIGYDTTHNDTLVFDGPGIETDTIDRLETASGLIDRAVFVNRTSTTEYSSGHYYESRDGQLMEVDTLGSQRHSPAEFFDYFAREYDIHGPL